MENVLATSTNTQHTQPFNLTIQLLGIDPLEGDTYVYQKTCTRTVIVILFMIAEDWLQTKCSSEVINKLCHNHAVEFYMAMRMIEHNLTKSHSVKRKKPEIK